MKIKMKVAVAGPNHAYGVGQTVDAPDDRAERLVEAGQAEPAEPKKRGRPPKGETADAPPEGESR